MKALFLTANKTSEVVNDEDFICETGFVSKITVGNFSNIRGVTMMKNSLWFSKSRTLYEYSLSAGEIRGVNDMQIPRYFTHLCNDGRLIYCLDDSFGEGRVIHIFDTERGGFADQYLVTNQDGRKRLHSSYGIAYKSGYLYVLARTLGSSARGVYKVDPMNGNILEEIKLELDAIADPSIVGLTIAGDHFVTLEIYKDDISASTTMHYFNMKTGLRERGVVLNCPVSTITHDDDVYFFPGNRELESSISLRLSGLLKREANIYKLVL